MSSRGGGKPRRNREAETNQFIKAVETDKSISDLTRKELIAGATKELGTFKERQTKLPELMKEFNALRSQDNSFGMHDKRIDELGRQIQSLKQGSTFDKGAASLRKDLNAAREGRTPKFRYRQALEKKRELMMDRPGQKQLIFSNRGK